MDNNTRREAERLEAHLLDEKAREMVRGAHAAGMDLEECVKSLTRALYAELPPGSPKGPIVRKAEKMIRDTYAEQDKAAQQEEGNGEE